MTFEEFFKKKKIDLERLATAEPILFTEFRVHYAQMGEKSFDHTKKYWFNRLRRTYHTPDEVKLEKLKLENPLAEQVIIGQLTEDSAIAPEPGVGFKTKFKVDAASTGSLIEPTLESANGSNETSEPENLGLNPSSIVTGSAIKSVTNPPENDVIGKAEQTDLSIAPPKLKFKPKFKTGSTKPVEETVPVLNEEEPYPVKTELHEYAPAPAILGLKPKFKAAVQKPTSDILPGINDENQPITNTQQPDVTSAQAKLGFKPKFKAGATKTVTEPTKEAGTINDTVKNQDIK